MTKLYDLSNDVMRLQEDLDNGVIAPEDVGDTLDMLSMQVDKKAEAIVYVMKNLKAPILAIDEEIKRLQAKKKAIENKTSNLLQYICDSMVKMKMDVIQTDLIKIRLHESSGAVVITDRHSVPDEFITRKFEVDIDKEAIKEALKAGPVAGAELKKKKYVRIY